MGYNTIKNNFKNRAWQANVTIIFSSAISRYQALTLTGERDWKKHICDNMPVSINTFMFAPLLLTLKI